MTTPPFSTPHTRTDTAPEGWHTFSVNPHVQLDNDPCETLMGPFYFRELEEGGRECMFIPTERHNNNGGNTHGGALMTFADYALFAHSAHVRTGPYVTVQFESQFIGAGVAGIPLYSRGEIIRTTRDLIFVRGVLTQNEKPILSYSGIIKKVVPR